jgi:hypothetical protein
VLADRAEALEAGDMDKVEAVEMMMMMVDLSMLVLLHLKVMVNNRILASLRGHEVKEAEGMDVALAMAPMMDPRIGIDS